MENDVYEDSIHEPIENMTSRPERPRLRLVCEILCSTKWHYELTVNEGSKACIDIRQQNLQKNKTK